jgi:ATP-dependent helicase HrpB
VLSPESARLLARELPERVTLPGGRSVPVHYLSGQPPWIASRLQDFFGMREGPALARGRVPLVLHLLAPNQRAVQVTQDLAGFWSRHYPSLRRELGRRYPRHAWPEDPLLASPPPPRRG